jgi:hypothetical protein
VHAALITLFNMLLLIAGDLAGRPCARQARRQRAATIGHPDFERAFRAHQNTIESTVLFLPPLWIAQLYGDATSPPGWATPGSSAGCGTCSATSAPPAAAAPASCIGALANIGLLGVAFWGLLPPLVRIG